MGTKYNYNSIGTTRLFFTLSTWWRSPSLGLRQFAIGRIHPAQQGEFAWIGGQGTDPYEQNTQQSPGFGFRTVPQPWQS